MRQGKTKRGPPRRQRYDVIVIGSGIGGLCAAALLARAGRSVLVLERHDRPGGYAHSFARKRYRFDSGVHLTSGCGPTGYDGGQLLYRILDSVGATSEVEFIPVDPLARVIYPGLDLLLPASASAFTDTLVERFPNERHGLNALVATALRLAGEAANADEIMQCGDAGEIQRQLPTLLHYRRTTLAEALAGFVQAPEPKAVASTLWPFLGLPPSELSFVSWATMFAGYTADGACYCKGTFQKLAEALVSGIVRHGGEIRYGAAVRSIDVDRGRVRGVQLEDGRPIAADSIVSNADMHQTVHALIGEEHFPESFLRRLRRMKPSLSIFTVYIATDLDLTTLGLAHESFFFSRFDHDTNFRDSQAGRLAWLSATVPTLADASLAPPGHHIVMLTTLMPYHIDATWQSGKQTMVDAMVRFASRFIPGLDAHLLYVDGGSPLTMARYTLNRHGAAYGWATTPDQTGPQRIANKAPIEGLYWAGHWSSPGCGVYGVAVSGLQAAQAVLGLHRRQDLWECAGRL